MKITRNDVPWGWSKFLINNIIVNVLIPVTFIIISIGVAVAFWVVTSEREFLFFQIATSFIAIFIIVLTIHLAICILRNQDNLSHHWICPINQKLFDEEEITLKAQEVFGDKIKIIEKEKCIHGEPKMRTLRIGKYRIYMRYKKYLIGSAAHVWFGPVSNSDDIHKLVKFDKTLSKIKFGSWKGENIGRR